MVDPTVLDQFLEISFWRRYRSMAKPTAFPQPRGETGRPPSPTDLAQMAYRWHGQRQQRIQEALIGYMQHHGQLV